MVVLHASNSFSVPVEIPFVAILAICAACIGRTRGIKIKSGWIEHANLYLCLISKSGTGKSPATKAFLSPIFAMEKQLFDEYQESMKQYEIQMAEWKRTLLDKEARVAEKPEKPKWKQIYIDDATIESVADALDANPSGILWYRDELAGLILDLDKYTGKEGSTKSRLLSAYDSGPWKSNRIASSRQNYIENACLSIFGTIQPKAVPLIFN